MRWVFLIQFCVGCWYTIVSGSQLSYTPIFTFTQMRFRSRTQVRVLLYHISQACQPLKFIFFLCYNIIVFGA